MHAPFGSWGTQTLIAGLSQTAFIAPWVIKGAMGGPAFATYVRAVLIPEIEPGTVVVLDNLANHRNKEAVKPFANVAVGSSACHHTVPISIRSKWPFPNSKRIYAASVRGLSQMSSMQSRKFANSLILRSALITSMLQDVSLTKLEML